MIDLILNFYYFIELMAKIIGFFYFLWILKFVVTYFYLLFKKDDDAKKELRRLIYFIPMGFLGLYISGEDVFDIGKESEVIFLGAFTSIMFINLPSVYLGIVEYIQAFLN